MPNHNDEEEEWDLDPPTLPQPLTNGNPQHESLGSSRSNARSTVFFTLPLELRNNIYRYLVISPLSQASHCQLYRPLCVDDVIFRIGYFEKDTVMPLLLTCRQMHVEASMVLYRENVFIFHASSLVPRPLPILDLLPQRYLRSMRKVYLFTEFHFVNPSRPVKLPQVLTDPIESLGETQLSKRRQLMQQVKLQGSKIVAQAAISGKSGFFVNVNDTVAVTTEGALGRLNHDLESVSWSSSCEMWKMVLVESEGMNFRQEFRRVIWITDTG
ncbi:MAG: hypothetical protein Q9219_006257 [cf. Caloplaca sp. 3 TL-2023]